MNEVDDRGWRTKAWTTKSGKPKGGTRFTKNTLHYLLRNVAYIGKVTYDDEIYEGEHDSIVSSEEFRAAGKQMQRNAQFGGSKHSKSTSLLSQLLHCKVCGCAMGLSSTKRGQRRYRYYVCTNAQKRGYDKCPAPTVSAPELEKFVIDQIREVGENTELRAAVIGEVEKQAELQRQQHVKKQQLQELELKGLYEQLRQAAIDQNSPQRLADLNELIRKKQNELDRDGTTEHSAASLEVAEMTRLLTEFDELWEAMTPREKQQTLRLLVERVDYDGVGGEVEVTFSDTGAQLTEVPQ